MKLLMQRFLHEHGSKVFESNKMKAFVEHLTVKCGSNFRGISYDS